MTKYRVNDAGVDKARQMIDAHQYDIETPWSAAAPDADDGNAQIERHGHDGYGEWHLGIDTDASEETKDRYGFPFGDFARVNRSALIHAKQRASQNGHDAIEAVADELLAHLDDVRS
ncbi:MAG: hypothetical protein CL424_08645 [Acidimicrobiaceae bacterium]|nr:hypothetical protein [Acidimicrobiaceae bacterium]